MNKKLLFGIMSLAALTACTNDDFQSQDVAQETSPVKFEVINDVTRAHMEGSSIVWSADDGDLFTLYHGAALGAVTGFQNATYTANANPGGTATLSTPSMILEGGAIMVWPVDTAFRIESADNLSLVIPAEQTNIEDNIPYVSDLVNIGGYDADAPYNTAGLNRTYPVFMRPMASQLTIRADYVGTDAQIAELEAGEDGIDPIRVESVDLLTDATPFTTEIALAFNGNVGANWASVANNAWAQVTEFGAPTVTTTQLTAKDDCLTGNESCKLLLLPQPTISGGVDKGAVVVHTIYGKVFIGDPTEYDALPNKSYYESEEYEKAWYRYLSTKHTATAEENASAASKTIAPDDPDKNNKYKTVAKSLKLGMQQTINAFSGATASDGTVMGEPIGATSTRFVEVRLNHLDMSDLHIKTDKQLRDAARVWKKMNLTPVTVYLDGDDDEVFEISQKTIETINSVNAGTLNFKVQPCQLTGEECSTIVITGSAYKQDVQNIAFIADNGGFAADVVLADEGTAKPWKWNGTVKVTATGVNQIINEGTMLNAADAVLKTVENDGTQNDVTLVNNGTWNITGGTIRVQFDVTNNYKLYISKGAQYRQDGAGHVFTNDAAALPERFGGDDELIGFVENKGVFATIADGVINNYGLIEHADNAAKTYVTTNQTTGGVFTNAFSDGNKMGRINLPYSNKEEDNISVSAALNQGFISVTVNGEVSGTLNASVVGSKVNYVIVKSGITEIAAVSAQVDYLEINQPNTELAWNVAVPTTYTGLMVLSDVNIKLGTTIAATVTYLGADMYVGGKFNIVDLATPDDPIDFDATKWSGYYGNTSGNVPTKYVTY